MGTTLDYIEYVEDQVRGPSTTPDPKPKQPKTGAGLASRPGR
jgi:hypothetical protein